SARPRAPTLPARPPPTTRHHPRWFDADRCRSRSRWSDRLRARAQRLIELRYGARMLGQASEATRVQCKVDLRWSGGVLQAILQEVIEGWGAACLLQPIDAA